MYKQPVYEGFTSVQFDLSSETQEHICMFALAIQQSSIFIDKTRTIEIRDQ